MNNGFLRYHPNSLKNSEEKSGIQIAILINGTNSFNNYQEDLR